MESSEGYTNPYSGHDKMDAQLYAYAHMSGQAIDIDMSAYELQRREQIANWIKLRQQFERVTVVSMSTRLELQYAWATMDWAYRPIYTTKSDVPPTMSLLITELRSIIWRSLIGRDRDLWPRAIRPYPQRHGFRTAYAELQETIHTALTDYKESR